MVTLSDRRYYWASENGQEVELEDRNGVITVPPNQPVTKAELEAIPEVEVQEWIQKSRVHLEVSNLWQSAHNYEYEQISGSAIGLIAMGVLSGLPKALAVQGWIKSIWALYYTRKAEIQAGGIADNDFTSCGPIPHTVPELMEEAGV